MSSVFERSLPHENLNKAIEAAMRAANMLPPLSTSTPAATTAPDTIVVSGPTGVRS